MLTYKALNSLALQYLKELLIKCLEGRNRNLRSAETNLQTPMFRTCGGQKAFSYREAKLLNILIENGYPDDVISDCFRKKIAGSLADKKVWSAVYLG